MLEGEEDFCEEVLGLPLKGFFAQLQALVEAGGGRGEITRMEGRLGEVVVAVAHPHDGENVLGLSLSPFLAAR